VFGIKYGALAYIGEEEWLSLSRILFWLCRTLFFLPWVWKSQEH